jgi:hypothetical protein
VLDQPTFEIDIDYDYRYFESMWDYMESGLNAEIISVEGEDDNEFEDYATKEYHGRVLVLLKNIMIKGIKKNCDMLEDIIDIVSEKALKARELEERRKEREKKKKEKIKEEKKKNREFAFKFACYNSIDLELKTNMLRYWLTSWLEIEMNESVRLCLCVLLALASELV